VQVRCVRNTASAGGLLFCCVGCLTSYCEDCLPQDEIEGIGRHRSFEELGYASKQGNTCVYIGVCINVSMHIMCECLCVCVREYVY